MPEVLLAPALPPVGSEVPQAPLIVHARAVLRSPSRRTAKWSLWRSGRFSSEWRRMYSAS